MFAIRNSVCALVVALPMLAAAAPPVTEFTAFPKYDSLVISPGGTRLALTQREGDKHLLTIVEFPSMKPVKSFSYGDRIDVENARWMNEDQLIIQPARLMTDLRAYKIPTGEIIRVDQKAGKSKLIYTWMRQNASSRAVNKEDAPGAANILSLRSNDPDELLFAVGGSRLRKTKGSVWRLNVQSGRFDQIAFAPTDAAGFVMGPNRGFNVSVASNLDGKLETYVLEPSRTGNVNALEWVKKIEAASGPGDFLPLAWTGKGDDYFALDGRNAPTVGVVSWNAKTNEQKLLFRNPEADLGPRGVDPKGYLWLFAGTALYPTYWYPDPEHPLARAHKALVAQLPRLQVDISNSTDDMSYAVARISGGDRPPTFLVLDVRAGKPVQLMPAYPNLKAPELAQVDAIEFRARDGLAIRGFLTTPKGADGKPMRKLPMVVVIHGGPFGISDDYGYDFERQLLASHGYAVLQVNYRGSGGRGPVYERAGYRKWGREMQDDVTDGVRWAIQQGVADEARLCAYGGSYGAYSALTGAFREPDLFKCVIGMAGVYDLTLMYERGDIQMAARGVNYLKEALGEDADELRSRSPVYNAKAIKAKVFLLHGTEDWRAPIAHAERLRKALEDAGNPPEWLVESGEGHGFFGDEHRAEAYGRILGFLDKNIGH